MVIYVYKLQSKMAYKLCVDDVDVVRMRARDLCSLDDCLSVHSSLISLPAFEWVV